MNGWRRTRSGAGDSASTLSSAASCACWRVGGRKRNRRATAPIAAAAATMCEGRCCIFFEILIALLLPPLGVFLRHGCCSLEFCISLLLTFLGYVPGMIYAVYVIVAVDPETYRYREGYWQPING